MEGHNNIERAYKRCRSDDENVGENGRNTVQAFMPVAQSRGNQYGDVAIDGNARVQLGDTIIQYQNESRPRKDTYQILLESLTFEQMHSRLRNVNLPLPSTCQWIFRTPQLLAWADADGDVHHQGFLWIKGKPGSGKSTIMKEILAWAERTWTQKTLLLS